jgi:hypothetical protein
VIISCEAFSSNTALLCAKDIASCASSCRRS